MPFWAIALLIASIVVPMAPVVLLLFLPDGKKRRPLLAGRIPVVYYNRKTFRIGLGSRLIQLYPEHPEPRR